MRTQEHYWIDQQNWDGDEFWQVCLNCETVVGEYTKLPPKACINTKNERASTTLKNGRL